MKVFTKKAALCFYLTFMVFSCSQKTTVSVESLPVKKNLATESLNLQVDRNDTNKKELLKDIGSYHNLTHLEITGGFFDEIDYSYLSGCTSLRRLTLTVSSRFNNDVPRLTGISGFPVLPSIEILELINHELETLDGIEHFPNITNLHLEGSAFPNIPNHVPKPLPYLGTLSRLTHLRDLSIHYNMTSKIVFSDLAGLSELRELNLRIGFAAIDFNGIERLKNLEGMDIGECGEVINIEKICDLKNMKSLGIVINDQIKSLNFLSDIPSMETLFLINGHFSIYEAEENGNTRRYIDALMFRKLPNLKYLVLKAFRIENSHILNNLEHLENLGIEWCAFIPEGDFVQTNPNIRIYTGGDH